MQEIALITGASTGIGFEIAKLFAIENINLLIVSRDKQKLLKIKDEFENQYKIDVYTLATDLSSDSGVQNILDVVKSNSLIVNYLENNAGFGDYGAFIERSI